MTTMALIWLIVLGAVVLASVAAGVARYRAVMRRKWPEVRPLEDEDGNGEDW